MITFLQGFRLVLQSHKEAIPYEIIILLENNLRKVKKPTKGRPNNDL